MQQEQTVPSIHPHQGNCLIIEDSEFDSIKLSRVMAKSHGKMRVEVASPLQRASEALARGHTDLILLDNNLTDGLGANFAIELSHDEKLANIPVTMVRDWPSPFMWEKAATAGVSYVLSKTEFDSRYVHAALQNGKPKRKRMI